MLDKESAETLVPGVIGVSIFGVSATVSAGIGTVITSASSSSIGTVVGTLISSGASTAISKTLPKK
ncbi:hypothetical protein [Flavobacterium soli]|uniref:hypothetical protein n=1 Tax=Flavobacterium soli TaxID=344881 RepID=UPI00047E5FF2|nr:hypothetical protein [Flavobacterium soli]